MDSNNNIGFMGFSWQEKVRDLVKLWYKGTPKENTINTSIVDNVHRIYVSYLAKGYKAIDFSVKFPDILLSKMNNESIILVKEISREAKTDFILADRILRALYYLASIGKIPFEKYDPKGFEVQKQLIKKFDTEKSIIDKITPSKGKVFLFGMGIAGIAAIYLYSQRKRFSL